MNKIMKKTLIISIIILMVMNYFATIVSGAQRNIATNHADVEFDSYFKQGEEETTIANYKVNQENLILFGINVKGNGYIKDAKIQITGAKKEEKANFKIKEIEQNETIQKIDTQTNTIQLNYIKTGAQTIQVPIEIEKVENFNLENLSKKNKITFTATYVDKNGNEKQINKNIELTLSWTGETKVQISEKIEKYIPYAVKEDTGIIIQTKITVKAEQNVLPIKQTKIETKVPTIQGIKPTEVKVIAETTKQTNGDEKGKNFEQEKNVEYEKETGKLTITVANEESEEKIVSWKQDAEDIYLVTYKYPKEAQEKIGEEEIQITSQTEANIELYGIEEKQTVQNSMQESIKEKISNIISIENKVEKNISKGYLYANVKAEEQNQKETNYASNYKINIAYAEPVDKLTMQIKADDFVKENEKQTIGQNAKITKIILNKEEMQELLGKEGKITIKLPDGTIKQINEETENNQNIEIDMQETMPQEIEIETTKPQKEGNLNIVVEKAIKANTEYNKEQIQSFTKIEQTANITAKIGETTIAEEQNIAQTNLTEPTMKSELNINKTKLSTVTENKNVKITAVLNTANVENTLYTNPTIEIQFPQYIENIKINKVQLLLNEELEITSQNVIQKEDGTKAIIITTKGEQTKYDIGLVAGGANIIIDADIKVKTLTPTVQEQVKMKVTNNEPSRTIIGESFEIAIPIEIETPSGIVTINKIKDYNKAKEAVQSQNNEKKEGEIDLFGDKQTATLESYTMNNNGTPLKNISILGNTIYQGNKNKQTGEELGTTINAIMTSKIAVSGIEENKVTIYYTENGEATKDINNVENGWTQEPQDLSKVKAYLIVLAEDYEMKVGETIGVAYTAEVPGNLSKNQYGYTNYIVQYTEQGAAGETLVGSTPVGITTGAGPELSIELTSNVENNKPVQEGQIIKYRVTVKNIGKVEAKGVLLGANIPKELTYMKYVPGTSDKTDQYIEDSSKKIVTKGMSSLGIGETETLEFEVKVNTISDIKQEEHEGEEKEEKEPSIKVSGFVVANGIDEEQTSNEITNKIEEGFLSATMVVEPGIHNVLRKGAEVTYKVELKNVNSKTKQNVVVTNKLPEGLNYKESYYQAGYEKKTNTISYDKNTKEVTFNIGDIKENETVKIYLVGEISGDNENITSIANKMKITGKNNGEQVEIETNEITSKVKIEKAKVEAKLTCDIPEGDIEEGDTLNYILEIKNTGTKSIGEIEIIENLPEGLTYISSKYSIDGNETSFGGGNSNNVSVEGMIPVGKTLRYTITVKVDKLPEGQNNRQIKNSIKIRHNEIEEFSTNTLTHNIIAQENSSTGDNNNEDIGGDLVGTRKIRGTVWEDKNQNGQKETTEKTISGVEVMLYNYKTGNVVVNGQGQAVIKTTDSQGQYQFDNIESGDYVVIFKYDTANYRATEYRKEKVDSAVNSDAFDSKVTLNGVQIIAAITEKTTVKQENLYNIDLGLVETEKFDLKLTKTVSKITVTNSKGTEIYEYNTDLAKKEIVAKYINESTVIIEYKIAVTNEGGVEGYAKKIVDYLPKELKFNAELNRDWYKAENGAIYTSSLANTKIAPGETKEVKLYLTKSLTEKDLGTINNTAEIYESYNEKGIQDIDSTPGNKVTSEDDFGSADVILSVKTGAETIIAILVITIIICSAIGVGAYFLRKRILKII